MADFFMSSIFIMHDMKNTNNRTLVSKMYLKMKKMIFLRETGRNFIFCTRKRMNTELALVC